MLCNSLHCTNNRKKFTKPTIFRVQCKDVIHNSFNATSIILYILKISMIEKSLLCLLNYRSNAQIDKRALMQMMFGPAAAAKQFLRNYWTSFKTCRRKGFLRQPIRLLKRPNRFLRLLNRFLRISSRFKRCLRQSNRFLRLLKSSP